MFAPYLKNLRVKLQERKDAVLRAKHDYVESHLKTFLEFISAQPVLSSLTAELYDSLTGEDKKEVVRHLDEDGIPKLPADEVKRAAYLVMILNFLVDKKYSGDVTQKLAALFRNSSFQDDVDEYTEQLFLPLYHYYDEKIDDSDLLLYQLLKYKRLSEWFDREKLCGLVDQNAGKREETLDLHLRRFLVDQGFDYPFSTPSSPKGRADIVVHLEEKPLPLEVKLFDAESYGRGYIKKGFTQVLHYTEDYHQGCGYLVVFNLSDRLLQFGKTSTEDYFPRIQSQNKTIFVISVNIHPVILTASQEREPKIVIIDEEYLLGAEMSDQASVH